MTERFFIDNRRKLATRLEEGSAAVLFAGKAPLKPGGAGVTVGMNPFNLSNT